MDKATLEKRDDFLLRLKIGFKETLKNLFESMKRTIAPPNRVDWLRKKFQPFRCKSRVTFRDRPFRINESVSLPLFGGRCLLWLTKELCLRSEEDIHLPVFNAWGVMIYTERSFILACFISFKCRSGFSGGNIFYFRLFSQVRSPWMGFGKRRTTPPFLSSNGLWRSIWPTMWPPGG